MLKNLLTTLLLVGMAQAVQVATPVIFPSSGTFINVVQVGMLDSTSPVTLCYTLDGSTPTAATPGTCDNNGSIYAGSSSAAWANVTVNGTVLKAIGTAVGLTNSNVATSSAYTITSLPTTNPISAVTPTKITSAGANIVDELPFLMKAANGDLFLFYGESTGGVSVDNGANSRIMFKKSTNGGSSWTSPANFSCPGGDPATGCFYDNSSSNTQNLALGGGTTSTGTMIMLSNQATSGGAAQSGVLEFRSTDNGATWTNLGFITTPSHLTASFFENPTANMISIPSGSPGVTGSCATGCIFNPILQMPSFTYSNIFSFDDGLTWADPVAVPQTWPYQVEERAVIWLGGMNLMMFSRPSWTFQSLGGVPQNMVVLTSTDLGTTWNSYTPIVTTLHGGPSNLPIGPCAVGPQVNWNDSPTRPSVATDPNNPALSTLLWGRRFTCNGVTKFEWEIVTFNASTAFSGAGLTLPLPQILDIDPIVTAQPHTTYSYMIPLNSTQLLMAFEQGNTTTTEDIYTTVISYMLGSLSMASGVQVNGGVTVK